MSIVSVLLSADGAAKAVEVFSCLYDSKLYVFLISGRVKSSLSGIEATLLATLCLLASSSSSSSDQTGSSTFSLLMDETPSLPNTNGDIDIAVVDDEADVVGGDARSESNQSADLLERVLLVAFFDSLLDSA